MNVYLLKWMGPGEEVEGYNHDWETCDLYEGEESEDKAQIAVKILDTGMSPKDIQHHLMRLANSIGAGKL